VPSPPARALHFDPDMRALVLALASASLLVACVVGDPTVPAPGGDGEVDAGPRIDAGGMMDGGGNGNACDNLVTPAPTNGHHRPGEGCLNAGCHAAGGGGPRFYAGGTAYTTKAGAAVRPGATIILPTGGGTPTKMIVASNGNFWTTTPLTLTNVKPKASGCPNIVQMTAATSNGNCNTAGCHAAGNRIALPL
jgi:hypothetical protein